MARNSVSNVQIYLNPGLIDLIKTAFFNGPTAFRYKFKKHYVMLHPDHKEPELTIPMVALSATAVSNTFDHDLTITDMMIQVFFSCVQMVWREKSQDELGQFQGSEGWEIWRQQFQEGLWPACRDLVKVEKLSQHISSDHVDSLFKNCVCFYLELLQSHIHTYNLFLLLLLLLEQHATNTCSSFLYHSSCITRILHASDACFSFRLLPHCQTHVEHVLILYKL